MKTGVRGIFTCLKELDFGFPRNDKNRQFQTFYEVINLQ
jgi:hypothetical protein